jgi:hypothetical protein
MAGATAIERAIDARRRERMADFNRGSIDCLPIGERSCFCRERTVAAGATLTAGGILAIVALHMITE